MPISRLKKLRLLIGPAAVLALVQGLTAVTAPPPWWGDLTAGSYAVGFRTAERYDYSRTLGPDADYFGRPDTAETARPIQICIWYPAVVAEDDLRMVYGEYVFPAPEDDRFFELVSSLQRRELGVSAGLLGNSQALMHDAMNTPMMAARDAEAAAGSFPLVIFHPDYRGGYCQNIVLCEHLASHGFVIVTSHPMGATSSNMSGTEADLETGIRDREFAAATARELPAADCRRLGAIGIGSGGTAALLHQMRNSEVDAVVCLNGEFAEDGRSETVTESAFFDPGRMQVPLLNLFTEDGRTVDLSVLDSLRFSDRYSYNLKDASASAFTHYDIMALPADSGERSAESVYRSSRTICQYTVNFLKAVLHEDESAMSFMQASPADHGLNPELVTASFAAAEEAPPTAGQFVDVVRSYGVARAAELCERFDLCNPDHPILGRRTFTGLGYEFMRRRDFESALTVFGWGTAAYPNSANAWDSYGEACMANGDNELALSSYHHALEILPADSAIHPVLRESIQTNVPGIIERLERLIAGDSDNQDDQ